MRPKAMAPEIVLLPVEEQFVDFGVAQCGRVQACAGSLRHDFGEVVAEAGEHDSGQAGAEADTGHA